MRQALGLSAAMLGASAWMLVLAMSVSTLGPVLHGAHDSHDVESHDAFVVHDESTHYFDSATTQDAAPLTSDHCVACHFARASRGAVAWELTGLTTFVAGQLLFHSDGQLVAAPDASPTPARAPPTL